MRRLTSQMRPRFNTHIGASTQLAQLGYMHTRAAHLVRATESWFSRPRCRVRALYSRSTISPVIADVHAWLSAITSASSNVGQPSLSTWQSTKARSVPAEHDD